MSNFRVRFLYLFILIAFSAIVYRLFTIQIVKGSYYLAKADGQQIKKQTLPAKRGNIYIRTNDQNIPLAITRQLYIVAINPQVVEDKVVVSKIIAETLDISFEETLEKLKDSDSRYMRIASKVEEDKVTALKSKNIRGLLLEKKDYREYPQKELFGYITGFVNDEGVGVGGVEQYYQSTLEGKAGILKTFTDSHDIAIIDRNSFEVPPRHGSDIYITIDPNLQKMAYDIVAQTVHNVRAEHGDMIIMDPSSGAIKAYVSYPGYDPNQFAQVANSDPNLLLDGNINRLFEPGSGFKTFTMSAGIDSGKVTAATRYFDSGEVSVLDKVIYNAEHRSLGWQTMEGVIEKSLNTGVVFVLKSLGGGSINYTGKKKFFDYIKLFGFGGKTGINIGNEEVGQVRSPDDVNSNDLEYANMTFGQGLLVSNMQLLRGINTFANHGILVTPYIAQESVDPITEEKHSLIPPPTEQARIIGENTAQVLTSMMTRVVDYGSGYRARLDGIKVAGKSGTAQMAKSGQRGYDESRTIGSFTGFFPANNPRISMMVRIDAPGIGGFAESTAVPPFGEMAKKLVNYYGISAN